MTREEKAQAHDEALERARKLHSEYRTIVGTNIPEEIFPELKESEDVMWRNWLIGHLVGYINQTNHKYAKVCKEAITWLKKQGESDETFGQQHPRWISVEDELPPQESEYEDNSIMVLATDGNGVYKGLYRRGEYLSGWFTHDMWKLDNITHWMPLPAPPEKGGEQ